MVTDIFLIKFCHFWNEMIFLAVSICIIFIKFNYFFCKYTSNLIVLYTILTNTLSYLITKPMLCILYRWQGEFWGAIWELRNISRKDSPVLLLWAFLLCRMVILILSSILRQLFKDLFTKFWSQNFYVMSKFLW